METFSLKPSSAKYGWSSSSSNTTNVSADKSLWCGACKNSDGINRPYDGSMRFYKSLESISGGVPIVVTSASVTVEYRNRYPSKALNVFINEIEAAYWHAYQGNGYVGETTGNYMTFTSAIDDPVFSPTSGVESTYIVKSSKNFCQKLTEYLNNNKTFYIHLWNNVGSNQGGVFKGYRETREVLTINWEYAASQATFINGNSLKTGISTTLKLNQADPTFKHQIKWQIELSDGTYSTIETYKDITSSTINYTFSPDANQIPTWFKGATKIGGRVAVTTYNSAGTKLGEEKTTPFTLTLTKDSAVDIKIDSFTISPVTPSALGASNYVKNKTQIECKGQYTKRNSNVSIKEAKVILTGGISSSLLLDGGSGEEGKVTTSNYISEQSEITATWTIKDSRGFTWTSTQTIVVSSIKKYTSPKITDLIFYRSSGAGESIEGTKLGLRFTVKTDSSFGSNYIKSVTLNDKTLNPSTNKYTWNYSNPNVFSSETYDLSQNYNFSLKVTDEAGTTVTKTFILPSSNYLIHIPSGGGAIAFGTTVPSDGKGYIYLGWPIKGLTINTNSNLKLFGSNVSSKDSFQQAIGGPFLPIEGGTLTGDLTIAENKTLYLTNSTNQKFSALYAGNYFYVGLGALKGLQQHGKTYIGLGGTTTNGVYSPNTNLYLQQSPTTENGSDGKTYTVLHSGNYKNYSPNLSELYYKVGDTVEFTNGLFHGYTTDSKKKIYLIIPLSKRLDKINSVTINDMTGHIRNSGGYAVQSSIKDGGNDFTQYTITSTIITEGSSKVSSSIELLITGQTWVLTNNAAVSFVPVSFKMTFA